MAKIYDFTLTFHWDDNRDSSIGLNETGCAKKIIKCMEGIFPGAAEKHLLDILKEE
tara:strand:+ start:135 stop:302 length:168 start_codon:yes stop_codon:yes gene_type:complete